MNWKNNNHTLLHIVLLLLPLQCIQCRIYSFSGASTAATTIQVAEFYNNTELGRANIGQTFTNSLKDYYQQNSGLKITGREAELYIEGTISEYTVSPVSPTAAQSSTGFASLSRLTITVTASYNDLLEEKNNFKNQKFTFYDDFNNTQNFEDTRDDLEKKIFDQIMLKIYNRTVANW